MKLHPFFVAALFFIATLARAQNATIPLTFEAEGDREVWINYGLPIAPPTDAVHTKLGTMDVAIGKHKDTDAVFIWDHVTGNLASKSLQDIKNGWIVKESDFIDIAVVKVRVENAGKAVAAADVSLNDTRRTYNELLAPSNNGEVTFFAVKPGTQKVTVKFKGGEPLTQVFSTALKHSPAEPVLTIAIPGKVDTVGTTIPKTGTPNAVGDTTGAPATPGAEPAKDGETLATPAGKTAPAKAPEGGNAFGSLLGGIIAIVVVGGIVWFSLQYYKKNADMVNAKLEQLGVQVPKPGDDPGAIPNTPIPNAPIAPQPVQKIVLDDSAPTPLASAPIAPIPSFSGGPARLVSDGGDAIELPEGESAVGRDLGLWLSLAAESTVSRNHAALIRTGSTVAVRDNGSTNGTYVNGQRVSGQVTLTPGDNVQFGAVKFRYEA